MHLAANGCKAHRLSRPELLACFTLLQCSDGVIVLSEHSTLHSLSDHAVSGVSDAERTQAPRAELSADGLLLPLDPPPLSE